MTTESQGLLAEVSKSRVVLLNNETWLVCGGRDFSDQRMFDVIMAHVIGQRGCPRKIVHGAASGADAMADTLGKGLAIEVVACPADWTKHGKAAGPIRNEDMLMDHRPKLVIAFPGGRGTADMIARANNRRGQIDVIEVKPISQVLAESQSGTERKA